MDHGYHLATRRSRRADELDELRPSGGGDRFRIAVVKVFEVRGGCRRDGTMSGRRK